MDAKQTRQGVLLALAAYFIWGIAPAYFKLIYYVPADEILTHRVIWSFSLWWRCLASAGSGDRLSAY